MNTPKTAGIILAAGASKRFGSPKQLASFRGRPLLAWIIDAAVQSDLDQIILVLGSAHDQILEQLNEDLLESEISTFINHDYRLGQSSSLQLGLSLVSADHQAVMFLLADQPMTDASVINSLIRAFRLSPKSICVPVSNGKRGNPVIFGSKYFEALMNTRGDQGGREIIRGNPHDVHEVETADPQIFADIDTPEDLARLNSLKEPSRKRENGKTRNM